MPGSHLVIADRRGVAARSSESSDGGGVTALDITHVRWHCRARVARGYICGGGGGGGIRSANLHDGGGCGQRVPYRRHLAGRVDRRLVVVVGTAYTSYQRQRERVWGNSRHGGGWKPAQEHSDGDTVSLHRTILSATGIALVSSWSRGLLRPLATVCRWREWEGGRDSLHPQQQRASHLRRDRPHLVRAGLRRARTSKTHQTWLPRHLNQPKQRHPPPPHCKSHLAKDR